jgi:hypothetical protein
MKLLSVEYRRLVEIFRWAARVAAPAGALALTGCPPCPSAVDEIYLLRDPDAATQALIDACRDGTPPDCTPLCEKVAGSQYAPFEHCELHADSNGYVVVHVGWQPSCPGGRRPARMLRDDAPPAGSAAGRWFADLHQLEAASVSAFQFLHDELTAAGAPAGLRRAARAAQRDERRHAALVAALARRHGGAPRAPRVQPTPPRALSAMAEENAVEGCVREAFGALVAAVQAGASRDPVVRAAMRGIARDEARHAALALAVDAWVRTRLPPAARQRIDAARAAAIDDLLTRTETDGGDRWSPELGAVVGLPDPATSRALVAALRGSLWA